MLLAESVNSVVRFCNKDLVGSFWKGAWLILSFWGLILTLKSPTRTLKKPSSVCGDQFEKKVSLSLGFEGAYMFVKEKLRLLTDNLA